MKFHMFITNQLGFLYQLFQIGDFLSDLGLIFLDYTPPLIKTNIAPQVHQLWLK